VRHQLPHGSLTSVDGTCGTEGTYEARTATCLASQRRLTNCQRLTTNHWAVNIYETDLLLNQYLLFHYGTAQDQLPYSFGPRDALFYPSRCVTEFLPGIGRISRALDLGCAVGGSTFELARWADEVIGIDLSSQFIAAAQAMQKAGEVQIRILEEGQRSTVVARRLDPQIDRSKCRFFVEDALRTSSKFGSFDLVLAANLIDRVSRPPDLLREIKQLVRSKGHLILASPYTWLEEFTTRENWLSDAADTTLSRMQEILEPDLVLVAAKDLPFLIREHARKFQWSVAQASLWMKGSRS
jgi:putative 4-mercaptohistidine N1-methyltranferase